VLRNCCSCPCSSSKKAPGHMHRRRVSLMSRTCSKTSSWSRPRLPLHNKRQNTSMRDNASHKHAWAMHHTSMHGQLPLHSVTQACRPMRARCCTRWPSSAPCAASHSYTSSLCTPTTLQFSAPPQPPSHQHFITPPQPAMTMSPSPAPAPPLSAIPSAATRSGCAGCTCTDD